jgi:cytoplasmic FMR1 interacting protein
LCNNCRYNDAAFKALHVLKQRFLYDEIEAELNLVFEQLVFKLADKMFLFFKNSAAALLIDKHFRAKLVDDNIFSAMRLQVCNIV